MAAGSHRLGHPAPAPVCLVELLLQADERRRGRHHVLRAQQAPGVRRRRCEGELCGCGGGGRGGAGAEGDCRVPEDPREVHGARWTDSQGGTARRPAGHRQNAAGAGGGRRGQGPLLQHERIRVCRDVRGGRRGARPRSLCAGGAESAVHHLHRRARRARPRTRREPDGVPRGARADAQPAPGGDGRLRLAQGKYSSTSRTSRAAKRCSASIRSR
ncbi:MAG: hypothetical protein HW394_615 [Acidobacteria bacterium]|nr:hypothetical protein [Acidobacteriota bacterium]